jgi:hypothetical protein
MTPTDTNTTSRRPPTFLPRSIQENLLTALCFHEQAGKIVANMLDPALAEGEYRDIAAAAIDYWRQHNRPPGVHIADLFRSKLERGGRQAAGLRRMLLAMMQLADHLDPDFVVGELQEWTRKQKLKDGVLRAAERLANDTTPLEEIEQIFSDLVRGRKDSLFDPGVDLADVSGFLAEYRERRDNEFNTHIAELDQHNAVPARDTVAIFVGLFGTGKSWWLIHLGRCALLHHKKVLHVSLELERREVRQRYYQAFMAVPSHETYRTITRRKLRLDDNGRLTALLPEQIEAAFSFRGLEDQAEGYEGTKTLDQRLAQFVACRPQMFRDLRIRHSQPGTLTVGQLRGYLDALEGQKFTPDLVLLDHANCLNIDRDNFRLKFGEAIQDLEALAKERHIAICTAVQANREAFKAKEVNASHTGEDFSAVMTVDTVYAFSRNELEEKHGLARVKVEKNRLGGQQKFGVVLGQNIAWGQFAVESAPLTPAYFDLLEQLEEPS